jgi:hypothetical protein
MAASCSSSWHRFQTAIRPDWLPPGGIGNGWTRRRWAVLVNADASVLILLLDTLREAGIPVHAARLGRLGRRAPASLFRVWVDSGHTPARRMSSGRCCCGTGRPPGPEPAVRADSRS